MNSALALLNVLESDGKYEAKKKYLTERSEAQGI